MGTVWMCHCRSGSQEAPAQIPGVMATQSPAAGCPRDHGADPPPSSLAVLVRQRRATPGIPEGHHGQETGLQEPLRSPCRVPLFFVSALHSQVQVLEPEVSFQPELSTCLTCALGLCNHPAASVGLLLPEALSLVSPKLQAPHLGQEGLPDAGRGQQSVWAGAGSAVQGAQGRLPHLPLVRLPLLQQGSAWSRLGCCEKIGWKEAPRGCGLAPGSSTLSQLQFCSVYVGQKNQKTRMGPHPVSFAR